MRQNNFDGKSWNPHPLLFLTFFDIRNFLKHRRVYLRNDSVLWDKNFFEKKIVILPPSPRPSLIQEIFHTRNFVKQHRSVPNEVFRYCEKKQFRRKIVINRPPSRSYPWRFSITENNETLKDSPSTNFSTVRQKNSDGNPWCSPSPSYPWTYSLSENFWNTAQKGSSTNLFDTVRHQIFHWKSWYSPLRNKNFPYPKLSETQKGSSTNWFGTVRQNNFYGKSWYPPPLLSLTFFDTRNFQKHRRVPLQKDSVLWDINFWQKIVILPPCLIPNIFR